MSESDLHYGALERDSQLFTNWLASGYFQRDAAGFANPELKPYTIVIPPPNVTGRLHMGHALNNTLQDILIRKARMQHRPTRWIVGTDHAGIATQNKVEQRLQQQGLTRFDLGRAAFVAACWDWREEYGNTIIEQLKGLGASCDYSAEKFTMDPEYARAIRRVFVDWYHAGLVYRGLRIINWCPRCTTALADDEVTHKDEASHLWYIRYPLTAAVDGREYLVVATTRPETMLGDTAVAVHPEDPRYQAILTGGVQARLPLLDRLLPIVADDYVDRDFGTGAVKVTPAHDPNDFEIARRHDLELLNIFNEQVEVTAAGGPFAGLDRDAARQAVLAALTEQGLLDHVEDIEHAVGHCYRCDTTIEPWASEQWFVRMADLAAPAIAAVRQGRIHFNPARWDKVYYQWLENIRDWCISRQLWWGHRIPVFYCTSCDWQDALTEDPDCCPRCGGVVRQDDDVLDTWFSSQLWPFATYGWPDAPDAAEQLASYYPTQVLSTARDIIFLWVARMIISSLYFLADQIPFADVIIHPTVLDRFGNIMSKSRGNGIDPMDLIQEFGADVMRFGLAAQVTGMQDLKFDQDKLSVYRNFATKIENAARFVLLNLSDFRLEGEAAAAGEPRSVAAGAPAPGFKPAGAPEARTVADRWILSRLARLAALLDDEEQRFEFGVQARALYVFFWNEFCDWYIEIAKTQLSGSAEERAATQRNLVFVLDTALRLLHPMMPFLTESLWLQLPKPVDIAPSLVVADWPAATSLAGYLDSAAEQTMDLTMSVVAALRSTRARYRIASRQPLAVLVRATGTDSAGASALLASQKDQVEKLGNCSLTLATPATERPAESVLVLAENLEISIVLAGLLDFATERQRLAKAYDQRQQDAQRLRNKLQNPGFLAKAAPEIIEKTQRELEQLEQEINGLALEIEELRS